MRPAVVFEMFGPYHLARLNALGATQPTLGVEIAARSGTYRWQRMELDTSFKRRTLFDVDDISELTRIEIDRAVAEELNQFRPDIVFAPGWTSREALSALRWSLAHNVPCVVMSESTRADRPRGALREGIKRQVVKRFSGGFVGGDPHKKYLVELGMESERISLGFDVVDNAYFADSARRLRADAQRQRAKLGLPERYILASARFISIKNLHGLVDAFARFRRLRPASQTSLVLLGDGPERSAIEARRAELELNSAILMPGFKQYDELPIYYSLADCFVHVSSHEPWGLVVNEAMASDLPVIVSKACGCAANLVEHDGNGYLVSHCNLDEIARRIAQVDDDPSRRLGMAKRSGEIIACWGPDRFVAGATEAAAIAKQHGAGVLDLGTRGLLTVLAYADARSASRLSKL